jgi:hypothetical protein
MCPRPTKKNKTIGGRSAAADLALIFIFFDKKTVDF